MGESCAIQGSTNNVRIWQLVISYRHSWIHGTHQLMGGHYSQCHVMLEPNLFIKYNLLIEKSVLGVF